MTFWHLLKWEFRNGWALAMSTALAVSTSLFFMPNLWGTLASGAMVLLSGGVGSFLMRRTPWCSDQAFWRTRPITPGTLWMVRSVALMVLLLFPVSVVAWISFSGMGTETIWLGVGLLGSLAFLMGGTAAAVQATASRGPGWLTTAEVISLAPAFFVFGLMAWFYESPPSEGDRLVWVLLLTSLTVAVFAWLAWWTVGLWFRWKTTLVILALGSALFPLLIGGFEHWLYYRETLQLISQTTGRYAPMRWEHLKEFTALQKINEGLSVKEYPLELSENSLLRVPLWPVGLEQGQFIVPDRLILWDEGRSKWRHVYEGPYIGFTGGRPLGANERYDVFSDEHRAFSDWMDLERIWENLRKHVPTHQSWVPTDSAQVDVNHRLSLPEAGLLNDTALAVHLQGRLYQFHTLKPVPLTAPGRIADASGELELVSATVPNPNAMDVRLFWKRPVLGRPRAGRWPESSMPPEVWGILFHASSGTAYGSASLQQRWQDYGLSSILIDRSDLVMRFELSALEIALLGLDARQILKESTLYLFTVEKQGRVLANLEPDEAP
jgi:hypothetical protein